jgi:hypothetical protein
VLSSCNHYSCVSACPAGSKQCEATGGCEENNLDDEVCCGTVKQYCQKTKRCEWKATFDTICSKQIQYYNKISISFEQGCPTGEKYCEGGAACVNESREDDACCESSHKYCSKTDSCLASNTPDNNCGEADLILYL